MKKFYIVGAGPGEPDLITVMGLEAIRESQVVFKDALVSDDLIEKYCTNKVQVNVGHRQGTSSDVGLKIILNYIKENANNFDVAVHLKSGDPGIFSRLSEEIRAVSTLGFDVIVVPGITSAIGVPTFYGIPLSVKDVSRHIAIVTASISEGKFNASSLGDALKYADVVVVLMGSRFLKQIARLSQSILGHSDMLIVENGTLPSAKISLLKDAENLDEHYCSKPSIIILGRKLNEILSLGGGFDEYRVYAGYNK